MSYAKAVIGLIDIPDQDDLLSVGFDSEIQDIEERKKLHGSGFAIIEEVEDPSEKT